MPYIDHTDGRLFFAEHGEGALTLVLLHGLGSDSNDWSWVVPELAARYRVVALDLPGHGHSTAGRSHTLADAASAVLALAEHLGCDRFVPVGHSLGGAVAARLAVQHPDRVQAVVEVDPAYALPAVVVGAWNAERTQSQRKSAKLPDALLTAPTMSPSLRIRLANCVDAMDPSVFWDYYDGLASGPEEMFVSSPEAEAYLRRRTCPVLAIHSLRGRAQWETALFTDPASRAIEWEGSSHYLHIERHRELAVVLSAWLDEVRSRSLGPHQ
ncbi:alpha/beta fold hydrolase [Kribbella sp. NPDC051620]|uniref:alpha/beta fold hydrolase n=1 Tax=Kribbella sp. NPDC051620 TaxID=3364120 RepID=UPI0037B99E26